MPTVTSRAAAAPSSSAGISATRAMIPPSPWLSARMISSTYLSVTTITSDQKISEIAA